MDKFETLEKIIIGLIGLFSTGAVFKFIQWRYKKALEARQLARDEIREDLLNRIDKLESIVDLREEELNAERFANIELIKENERLKMK